MTIDFTNLNNACVLYYSMDNADVSGSTILDLTPNNNDGTINGATTGVSGILNEAFSFDGSNDYVTVSSPLSFDGNDEFHFNYWIKFNTLDGTTNNYESWQLNQWLGSSTANSFLVANYNNKVRLLIDDGSSTISFVESGVTLSTGIRYNVQGGYDGTNIYITVNNEPKITTPVTGIRTASGGFDIGGRSTITNMMNATMDEFSMFNKALNLEEYQFLYNQGVPTVNQQYPFSPNVTYAIQGQVTLSGTATQGATLRLYDQTGGTYEGSTTTDVSGSYLFENLTDTNEYHVTVEYDDGTTKYNDESKPYVTPTEQ